MCLQEQGTAAYDVVATVTEFISDPEAASLELPKALTAQQRKQAKLLAEQHEGVTCESFGFGDDRRLHLFKKDHKSSVSVKNTFIDDFVGNEAKQGDAESPHVKTLPGRLDNGGLWDPKSLPKPREYASSPTSPPPSSSPPPQETASAPSSPPTMAPPPPPPAPPPPQPADLDRSRTSPPDVGSVPDVLDVPQGFRYTVRDTFIHIEADAEPVADQRATQSMPDGMFQRHLQTELENRRALAAAAAAITAPPVTSGFGLFHPMPREPAPIIPEDITREGAQVVIEGLVRLPAFNGLTGTVDSLDPDTGRYNIRLDAPAGPDQRLWAKVRAENLRPRSFLPPPPAHHAPTVMIQAETAVPSGDAGAGIPPTPKWEVDSGSNTKSPVKLEALV